LKYHSVACRFSFSDGAADLMSIELGITNILLTKKQNFIMKKTITLITVLIAFSFASCKKEHDCVCTSTFGTEVTTSIKATKKKAKTKCEAQSEDNGKYVVTCKIMD
jgi:hypothetical protein